MSLSLDITKRYPGFTLDVALEAGEERIGLLGASGCGKSCTLRCIAGVETPDEGRIVVNGVTFFDSDAGVNLTPQQRKCALLFQNYQLFPNLTVADNVCAGMDRTQDATRQREDALRFLNIFGMGEYADRYPARLSGGQQQRVALARMLAARPGILMFDEPFSALDSYLKSALEQNLLDVFSVVGRTVLYVSHDIDEACRLCERIAVMHNGRIEEIGSVSELMERPATLAALRLTGCKNTSPAEKVGPTSVLALDWGMTFDVGREVPDDVAYLGIRASYFHVDRDRAAGERGRNSYDLNVARVSDSRFERLVLLDVPRADAPSRLQWRVNKVGVPESELPHEGDVLRMHFDARRIHLVSR
ncbi:ATP-binding cassette domain-containing protein [Collinsella tanakaei]|uniref:sulfate/molybdate ABC transporter ATP-binding protein n=1 Tax=Collinsella tanakaei TaxID=626935 RepID=UPI0025A34D9B|nr:ATP-binding cassette domain-containing protein [Collinsella tanakaei]MDM8245254.1 ATP-binding cassette domain-containing protein [Collinsella tanakaei]